MTPDEFREIALSFPDTTESAHMNHPDFRANGKIFATLGYPDQNRGMVKLTPADQKKIVEAHPQTFEPVKGAWGLQGSTSVILKSAKPEILRHAMDLAWQAGADAARAPKKSRKAKQD